MDPLFDFEDPPQRRGTVRTILMVLGALVLLAGIFWLTYPRHGGEQGAEDVLPLIRADSPPHKIEPDHPGGYSIPNRDSTLFDHARDARGRTPPLENLLADTERPLPREELLAGVRAHIPPQPPQPEPIENVAPVDITKTPAGSGTIISVAPEAEPESALESAQAAAPEITTEPEVIAPVLSDVLESVLAGRATAIEPASGDATRKTTPDDSGSAEVFYIQLGSVSSREAAQGEWKRLKSHFSGQLGSFDHRIERADLGEKGVYYRIQAGPVSRGLADSTCETIKQQKPGGCLVVRQ